MTNETNFSPLFFPHIRHKINIIGCCIFAAVVVASLFMNLTLSHIKSDQDVFIDQVLSEIKHPVC
jgi:hypothetical protein